MTLPITAAATAVCLCGDPDVRHRVGIRAGAPVRTSCKDCGCDSFDCPDPGDVGAAGAGPADNGPPVQGPSSPIGHHDPARSNLTLGENQILVAPLPDDALESFIRSAGIGVWHATCTCRMGADDDPMAVTDNQGRVRGVSGLRVVDASLFPCVSCANTNFPTLMTAEKISDTMLSGG